MKTKSFFLVIFLTALFLSPVTALADGIIIPFPPICDPSPCPPTPVPLSQLEIRYHHVDVKIENQVAISHVDQVFYNPNDWTIEGTYIFPIPHGAVVTDFILWIDGEPVEGQVLDADEARRTYEQIVREMQDPALLEYADQGAVQARIFPIPPGGERRIELEYSEVLTAENGLVRYIYPLNTEKFSTRPLDEVSVSVDVSSVSPIRAAYSASHPVDIDRDSQYHLTVGYEDTKVKPDTDFVFYYSIGENEAFHLLSYRDPSEVGNPDGFFALLLAPRPDAGTVTLPKDIILVLDRSGSMEGEKFQQAQEAIRYILKHLNPEDRYNLISFSTSVDTYDKIMHPADDIDNALAWVDRLSAVGSTDINRALLEASALSDDERPTYLIFLTDGLPTEGVVESVEILKNMSNVATDNLRLFAFGVGYDVDTFLLDSLAESHHGKSTYVFPGEPINEVLSTFYAKVSTPVLTNLSLDFGKVSVYDLYPSPLPDLFDGSQIVVVGRYRQGGTTDITLSGSVNNQESTFHFPEQHFSVDSLMERSGEVGTDTLQFIPRLWATRKIGYLLTQVRLNGPQQELIDQIVRLSIRYGIVTPYTSYLVTEPMPFGADEQERIAEEEFLALEAAPNAPTYGRDAVEKAAGQGEMEGSDVAVTPLHESADIVRVVGSRTFVFSVDAWVDTAYDPETMQTLKVAFLSDDYFALASSRSHLAAAFALGARVIAISDGIVYEVVDQDTPTEPIDIPIYETPDETPTIQINDGSATIVPEIDPTLSQNEGTGMEIQPDNQLLAPERQPCLGGLLPLVLLPLAVMTFYREKES